jgi:hypothetical protein
MARKTNLAAALHKASGKGESSDEELQKTKASTTTPQPPSRQGKKAITGHFDPVVSRQLKHLALERDTTVQALLAEALNALFEKYGKKPIA